MRRRTSESDPFTNSVRYALLALVFCALSAVELANAKFALLTNSELHAYWMGRYGRFPFALLPWSERHFGGDALAMRIPLLVVFAVMLAVVLLGLDRIALRKISAMRLTTVVVVALFALGAQQVFALKRLRAEKRAFFALRDRVERATAPGEVVVAEWNLAMPLYAYGSDALRLQLRSSLHSFPDIPPVAFYTPTVGDKEIIYVGSAKDNFAQRQFAAMGFQFREEDPTQPDTSELVAHYYRAAGAGIYFVSPPAKDAATAVSSKP